MEQQDPPPLESARGKRRVALRVAQVGLVLLFVLAAVLGTLSGVLIAFAGESPSSALGVGGFLVVIGLAFFLNSLFDRNDPPMPAGPRPGPVEPRRQD